MPPAHLDGGTEADRGRYNALDTGNSWRVKKAFNQET